MSGIPLHPHFRWELTDGSILDLYEHDQGYPPGQTVIFKSYGAVWARVTGEPRWLLLRQWTRAEQGARWLQQQRPSSWAEAARKLMPIYVTVNS